LSSQGKVSHAAAYAVAVLVVVVVAALVLNSRVGGVQVYDVYPTPSMVPTLEVGDLVVVHSVSFSSIQVGDVIVFSPPLAGGGCEAEVVVHRVVNITGEGLITQGDNRFTNPRPDEPLSWPPVTPECLKGQVVVSLPYLGKISEAFPPPLNYVLVLAIVALIFLTEMFGGRKEPAGVAPAGSQTARAARPQSEKESVDPAASTMTLFLRAPSISPSM
jgi:signal peptidase I